MKAAWVTLAWLVSGAPALAAAGEVEEYFYGQARIITLAAPLQADRTPMLLLKKATLPAQGLIVETATTVDDHGKMKDHVVSLKVDGNRLTITAADDSIDGTGSLSGPAWNWNLLQFSMTTRRGKVRIEDVNYRTPDRLIARKVISLPDGRPFMLWDVEARQISRAEYDRRYAEMHAPAASD